MKKIFSKIKLWFINIIAKIRNKNFLNLDSMVNYMYSAETLPAPLPLETEAELVKNFQECNDLSAKAKLIEHNLRLVMYIAKRFENNKLDIQDLISVGSIGLIKAVDSYNLDKNIKLATYARRCIENDSLTGRGNRTNKGESVLYSSGSQCNPDRKRKGMHKKRNRFRG